MTTLHTFGCSITQGHALPDLIKPVVNEQGRPYTEEEIAALNIAINWEDIHLYAPSAYAWPAVLARKLGVEHVNYARRGACFNQIARQCLVAIDTIKPEDTVIVMWTYLSRLSLQWPARTAVPLCNMVDPGWGWRTRILPGFNEFFGLSRSTTATQSRDTHIHDYIHSATKTYLDPMGVYDQYYRSLVLQSMTAGALANTGARVIHLSVEPDSSLQQLESARMALDKSLRDPYVIPDPKEWYKLSVDHLSCLVIHDSSIPPAENDMHPSVQHHENFAEHLRNKYFV